VTEARLFEFFGGPLTCGHPLAPVSLPPYHPHDGPLRKVHYVIELVGPHLIPSAEVKTLLESAAKSSLGDPEIFVKTPGHSQWRTLWVGDDSLAYDSVALVWDIVGSRGALSRLSAEELLRRCEHVGSGMQRKALATPLPEDIERLGSFLEGVRENLDIGVDLYIRSDTADLPLKDVLLLGYDLGLRLRDSGLLEWRQSGWDLPLFAMYPLGEAIDFDPISIPLIPGLGLGFSVPCSPNPMEVMERLIEAGEALAQRLGGSVYDDSGDLLTNSNKRLLFENLKMGIEALRNAGIEAGSREAMSLFEP
jgi:hypothetical protein